MNPLIVLVEDVESYALGLIGDLRQRFPELREEGAIRLLATETEFHREFQGFAAVPPKLFIIDIMLRYQDPGTSDESVPPEIRDRANRDRFYRAGIRCAQRLRADSAFDPIGIILHTTLDRADLDSDQDYPFPRDCVHVLKEENGQRILAEVGRFLGR